MAPSELPVNALALTDDPQISLEFLNDQLLHLRTENFKMSEDLQNVQLMLDDRGWHNLTNPASYGLGLHQVNMASRQIRELVVGNPTMGRGLRLRRSFIWGKGVGINFPGMGRDAKARLLKLMAHPTNQRCLFSADALDQLEGAAYTDGNVFILGVNSTKMLQRIPIGEISAIYANPDDHEDIWAVRRQWTRMATEGGVQMASWYFLDTYDGLKPRSINYGGEDETVDLTRTLFWKKYNGQANWVWGVPDALGAIAWSKLYRDFLIQGSVMSAAMAQILYKATAKTQDGVNKMTAGIRQADGAGQTVGMSHTMDLKPLETAGKGYDFASGDPLAAMIATALDVELEALLSKPGSDNADGISPATKRAMRDRQRSQADYIWRFLIWMGANPAQLALSFPEIDDVDPFRKFQTYSSAWGTGLFSPEEMRPVMAESAEIPLLTDKPPVGVLVPNNLASIQAGQVTTDSTTDGSVTTTGTHKAVTSGPKSDGSNSQSNGQGRNSVKQGKSSAGDNTLRDGTTRK